MRATLPSAAGLAGIVLAAALAQPAALQPVAVSGLAGTLRIVQGIPCGGTVDTTTTVAGGRIELTPAEGIDVAGGGKHFSLVRADIAFAPFSVSGSCLGIGETRNYGEVRVELARAVAFTATPTPAPGVFAIVIPRTDFLVNYVTTANGTLENGSKIPAEDVTGTIDLDAGRMQVRVVLATRTTFRVGCTDLGCLIDETHGGTITAHVDGTLVFPDADGDGAPDRRDNCRLTANPDQTPVATPALVMPPAVTLASCLSRAFGAARAADVCDGTAVTVTNDAPAQFDRGANLVTWRAADGLGRISSATQAVTVVDATAPAFTFLPPDITLNTCGPAALGTPAATDDCAGSPAFVNNAPASFGLGVTPVTWTATDVAGNSRTAIQTVTVVDTVAPTVYCVATQPTGNAFRVSSADACTGAPTIRLGSYVLADGETIHINETGQPGVRLVNTVGAARIKHFQVGRGEAVLSATDESGNVSTVACPVR